MKTADAFELVTRSPEETQEFGRRLGSQLSAGMVLALIGELGSGKTTLIQGLAAGLGIDQTLVKSPTFILLREYPGKIPLVHIDAYRLEGEAAAISLDLDWFFSPAKVTVIEWADRCAGCLPADRLELRLEHKAAAQRVIRMTAHGPAAQRALEALR